MILNVLQKLSMAYYRYDNLIVKVIRRVMTMIEDITRISVEPKKNLILFSYYSLGDIYFLLFIFI